MDRYYSYSLTKRSHSAATGGPPSPIRLWQPPVTSAGICPVGLCPSYRVSSRASYCGDGHWYDLVTGAKSGRSFTNRASFLRNICLKEFGVLIKLSEVSSFLLTFILLFYCIISFVQLFVISLTEVSHCQVNGVYCPISYWWFCM